MNNLNEYKVWTALITPMNNDTSVDYPSLEKLLKKQEHAGNGITLLGSTGEALNLEVSERKNIVNFVTRLDLDVPIMVGCGGAVLSEQLDWIGYLNSKKINAILLATPYYSKPGDIGQYEWFNSLFNASNFPVCLYNVPGRAAAPLSKAAFKKLADHKNFWALKEASGSVEEFISYRDAAPSCHMLSGDDPMFALFTREDAKGVVSVAGNVWPEAVQKIAQQFANSDFSNEELFTEASKSLFSASNPIPAKAIMNDKKLISSPELLLPLHKDDMRELDKVRQFDKELSNL